MPAGCDLCSGRGRCRCITNAPVIWHEVAKRSPFSGDLHAVMDCVLHAAPILYPTTHTHGCCASLLFHSTRPIWQLVEVFGSTDQVCISNHIVTVSGSCLKEETHQWCPLKVLIRTCYRVDTPLRGVTGHSTSLPTRDDISFSLKALSDAGSCRSAGCST
jgi:hypothetical protein